MNPLAERRLIYCAVICAVVFLAVFALNGLLSTNFSSGGIITAALLAAPAILALVLLLYPVWPGLILGGTTIAIMLPFPIIFRLEVGLILTGLICAVAVFRKAVSRASPSVFGSLDTLAMGVVTLIVVLRFAYDRPGSLRMGGTGGGGGEAVVFLAGILAYVVTSHLFAEPWDVRRNLAVILGMGLFSFATHAATSFGADIVFGMMSLFYRQLWFLCPLAFAYACHLRQKHPPSLFIPIFYYAILITILLLGSFSPHRSRLLFSVAIIGAVGYCYGRLRTTVLVGLVAIAVVILCALALNKGSLPGPLVRSFSTILPSQNDDSLEFVTEHKLSSETGWSSRFRSRLTAIAWENIRQHPIAGKGFILSLDDLMKLSSRNEEDRIIAQLATSGCYHNAVIELAVFCGLPAALAFVIGYFVGLWRFAVMAKSLENTALKLLCAAMLGFFCAESGQMLMNGSSRDFAVSCILLAAMRGIYVRHTMSLRQAEPARL